MRPSSNFRKLGMCSIAPQFGLKLRQLFAVLIGLSFAICVDPIRADHPENSDVSKITNILVGQSSRTWTYKETDLVQGTSEDCTEGDKYCFYPDHRVVWEHCVEKHVKRDTQHWSLSQEGEDRTILTIEGHNYDVLFKQVDTGWMMKLRMPSSSKTIATVDKEYYHKSE